MNRQAISPIRLITLCLSLLTLAVPLLAQSPPGGQTTNPNTGRTTAPPSHIIRGKIFLPQGGLPDQRIRVVLELVTGGIAAEVFSDSVGNFEFRSVPNNSYRVVVPGDNQVYETTHENLDVSGNFSRTFLVQIQLRNKGGEFTVKPRGNTLSAIEFNQEVPKAAKKSYEQGLKRAKEGKSAEAMALFQEALKVFPDYLLALNKLGEQYLIARKFDEAQATFERALAVNAKFPLAHINLGIILCEYKRYPEAIQHLEAANRVDESYPMSHFHLGRALMEKEPSDLDRAERAFLRACDLGGPEVAYVRLHLFNLNLRRQTYGKAVEQLEVYLKEAPNASNAAAVREALAKVKKMATQQAEQTPPQTGQAKKP
jgi:Tfp pilus assembly protein PilF